MNPRKADCISAVLEDDSKSNVKYALTDKTLKDMTDPNASFFDHLPSAKRRSWLEATIVHLLIRVKYFFASWFLIKPIFFSDLSAYPSMLRPKEIPQIDYLTLFGIRMLWIFGSVVRAIPLILFILTKLRIMQALNWTFLK